MMNDGKVVTGFQMYMELQDDSTGYQSAWLMQAGDWSLGGGGGGGRRLVRLAQYPRKGILTTPYTAGG